MHDKIMFCIKQQYDTDTYNKKSTIDTQFRYVLPRNHKTALCCLKLFLQIKSSKSLFLLLWLVFF